MKTGLTEQQKIIKEIALNSNPYDKQCPNRHLWNEGFQQGVEYARNVKNIIAFTEATIKHKQAIQQESETFTDEDKKELIECIASFIEEGKSNFEIFELIDNYKIIKNK